MSKKPNKDKSWHSLRSFGRAENTRPFVGAITIQERSKVVLCKEVLCSVLLGIVLGAVGAFLMSYVAALAIPREFFSWFDNSETALFIISLFSQFIAFGLIAIVVGAIIGRFYKRWHLNSAICYLAYLFYIVVGIAIIYDVKISNPFAGLSYYSSPTIFVLPLCLWLSTYLSARKS